MMVGIYAHVKKNVGKNSHATLAPPLRPRYSAPISAGLSARKTPREAGSGRGHLFFGGRGGQLAPMEETHDAISDRMITAMMPRT